MKKILIAVLVFAAVACSTTRITSSWNAKDAMPQVYKKILVLGLIKENDLELRKNMEQHLVDDLKSHGYNAISSLEEYGPKMFGEMDEEKVLRRIRKSGVDAVMTIVLLSKEQEREYIPAKVYYSPYTTYQSHFWGYYTTMNARIYEHGYYQLNTKYFWESNFYGMGDGKKVLYSVQTKSFNPSTASALAHEYGKLIVKDIIRAGVMLKGEPQLASEIKP